VDKQNPTEDEILEHIRIGFRLNEVPDAHFSIYVAPSNSDNPEGDSLEAQWKRIKEAPATPEEKKMLAKIKYIRESPRQIHDWKTGYEVLVRNPDEKDVHSYHDFQIKFTGVPHDPFRPYADVQFQTGVSDNAAGATKATLTDEEAIAVWDKMTSTIRVRPDKCRIRQECQCRSKAASSTGRASRNRTRMSAERLVGTRRAGTNRRWPPQTFQGRRTDAACRIAW
jgi:hypothetical protein